MQVDAAPKIKKEKESVEIKNFLDLITEKNITLKINHVYNKFLTESFMKKLFA